MVARSGLTTPKTSVDRKKKGVLKTPRLPKLAHGVKSVAAKPGTALPWFARYTGSNNEEYMKYMREEWGWEKRGDNKLFEKLCLEGQQAGLSWATVLAKRAAYRKAFHGFDIARCSAMTDQDIERILKDAAAGPGGREAVICHRGKLQSIVRNAQCVRALASVPFTDATGKVHRTLDGLIWSFVDGKPVLNRWASLKQIPNVTPAAVTMSKVLKKLGFSFVGPTICYSLMQSCGLVIDHPLGTPEHTAAASRFAKRKRAS